MNQAPIQCFNVRCFVFLIQASKPRCRTSHHYFTHSPFLSSLFHLYHAFPKHSGCLSTITCRRQRNLANLHPISTSFTAPLSFSVGLWNCQSAVNKADLISAFSLQSTLSILGLTETWIRPEDCNPCCSI